MRSKCGNVKATRFAAVVVVVLVVGFRQSGSPADETYQNLTLDQSVEIALAKYPPLKNQRESLASAESAYRAARGDFQPVLYVNAAQDFGQTIPSTGEQRGTFLSASVQKNFERGGSLSVVAESERNDRFGHGEEFVSGLSVDFRQPLLEGAGRDVAAANLKIAEINRDIARMALIDATRSHILTVTRAYHNVVAAERLLRVEEEALERARKSLERTEALVAEGYQAQIDLAKQELELAQYEERSTERKNAYRSALIGLRFILGVPPEEEISLARSPDLEINFEPDEPSFTPRALDMEEAKRKALDRRLDYLQQKRAMEIREIAVVTSKNVLLPDLSFFASMGLADSGSALNHAFHVNKGDWITGLQFEVPFGLVREREQYNQASISLRQAHNSLEQTRRGILDEVDNTVRAVRTTELRLKSAYRAVKNAQLSASGTATMYELGEISVYDRAQAQAELTSNEASYISLFLSYKDALAELDRAIAEPVEQRYGVSL